MDRNENVISMKKILYNLKRYFYIIIITVVIALIIALLALSKSEEEFSVTAKNTVQLKQNNTNKENNMYFVSTLNASSLVEEFKVYLSTESLQKQISDKLENNGYSGYTGADNPTWDVTQNVVVITVQGTDSLRSQAIGSIITDEFEKYVKGSSVNIDTVRLDSTLIETSGNNGIIKNIFSIKTLFILFLGGILGCGIILLLILYDNKIYVIADLTGINNFRCLYTVEKKNFKDVEAVQEIINYYCQEDKNRANLVITNEKAKKILSLKSLEDEKYNINKGDLKNVIFIITAGDDKKNNIAKSVALYRSMDRNIIGYILLEK